MAGRTDANRIIRLTALASQGDEKAREQLEALLRRKMVQLEKKQERQSKKTAAPASKEKAGSDRLAKQLVKMIRKHCIACMGGHGCKVVTINNKRVVEPDCGIQNCELYPVMRGEIDYE